MKAIVLFCLLAYFGARVSGNTNTPYPSSFDLRQVYPECSFSIYEEGVCTGNWAIAIADALSDLICIQKTNVPSPLSPQQILDCVDYADNSCTNIASSGTLEDALTYLTQNSLQTTTCYPYNSEFTGVRQTCQGTCEDGSAFVNGTTNTQSYVTLQTNDDIMSFIMSQGSAIAMFPIASDFLLYDYGVFVPAANAHPIGNHVVKLIGWGTDSTTQQQYWIASNSWSINWGLQGYFYIYQNTGLITQAYGIYV